MRAVQAAKNLIIARRAPLRLRSGLRPGPGSRQRTLSGGQKNRAAASLGQDEAFGRPDCCELLNRGGSWEDDGKPSAAGEVSSFSNPFGEAVQAGAGADRHEQIARHYLSLRPRDKCDRLS